MKTETPFVSLLGSFTLLYYSLPSDAEIVPLDAPKIKTDNHPVFESEDISGLAVSGDLLVYGSDEKSSIQFFDRVPGENAYEARKAESLFEGDAEELDIEGVANSGNTWFVAGSHSAKRKKVDFDDDDRKHSKNRERLTQKGIRPEPFRNQILRFKLNPGPGNEIDPDRVESLNLNPILEADPIFSPFVGLPSKENGIDIEGIATDGKSIWLGFRGPVLRNNWCPILKLDYEDPDNRETYFVNLGGRGIRELVKCRDSPGFLLIAGAVGDAPLPYALYYWNGSDTLPGKRSPDDPKQGEVVMLGNIPTPTDAKAEAMAILKETPEEFEILVAYDSAPNGGLAKFRVAKSGL